MTKISNFVKHINMNLEAGNIPEARRLIIDAKVKDLEDFKSDRIALARALALLDNDSISTKEQFYECFMQNASEYLAMENTGDLWASLIGKHSSLKKIAKEQTSAAPIPDPPNEDVQPQEAQDTPQEAEAPKPASKRRGMPASMIHGNSEPAPTTQIPDPQEEPEEQPAAAPESPKPPAKIPPQIEKPKAIDPSDMGWEGFLPVGMDEGATENLAKRIDSVEKLVMSLGTGIVQAMGHLNSKLDDVLGLCVIVALRSGMKPDDLLSKVSKAVAGYNEKKKTS